MEKIDVAVVGSSGYIGQELIDTIQYHPDVGEVYTPSRDELPEFEDGQAIFLALPHGESAQSAERYLKLGKKVFDFSGDCRFRKPEEYERWYGSHHPAPDILPAAYGLPERNRDDIRTSQLIAMPGCFPTATLLALQPMVEWGLIRDGSLITVDADTGISGAGKEPTERSHYMSVSQNVTPYNVGRQHRHVGEIEQFLHRKIFFSPSVVNVERGMLAKITFELARDAYGSTVRSALEADYESEPFVKLLEEGELPDMKETARTDECHLGLVVEDNIVQIVSSLDNLRKGGSIQGIHAFNIAFGLNETAGLKPKNS